VPKSELEGELEDSHMGAQARLISKTLRVLKGELRKSNCCFVATNQLREKIGVMFGNKETTPGGRAMKFYASVRIDIRRTGNDISNSNSLTKCKIVKNKVAPPFNECVFVIKWGKGIDAYLDVIEAAIENDVINKQGSWLHYDGKSLGQGKENVREFLINNNEVYEEIKNKILMPNSEDDLVEESEEESDNIENGED
jgi:recombination protein RecA